MRHLRLGCAVAALIGAATTRPAPAQINLLVNGSFEEPRVRTTLESQSVPPPVLPGWQVVAGVAALVPYSTWQTADHQGKQSLLLGTLSTTATMEQSVATTPGQSYLVSGWFTRGARDASGNDGRLRVVAGSDAAVEFVHGSASITPHAMRWKLFARRFKATTDQTVIRLTGNSIALDGLTVALAGSPTVAGAFTTVDLSGSLTHRLSDGLLGAGNDLVDLGDSITPQQPVPVLRGVPLLTDGVVMVGDVRVNEINAPKRVEGIAIGQKAKRLHFLHATHFSQVPIGTVIGQYILAFSDGSRSTIPIRHGYDLADWWNVPRAKADAPVAWTGRNEASARWDRYADWAPAIGRPLGIQLFLFTWTNPQPDVEIRSFDFVHTAPSSVSYATPFLVGLTGEN